MAMFPQFQEWMANRTLTEKASTPDYSIDRWIQSAKQLGSQVDSFVGQAKKKDSDLDKELEDKKKEKPEDKPEEPEDNKNPKDQDEPSDKSLSNNPAWDKLRTIAKERAKKEKGHERQTSGTKAARG